MGETLRVVLVDDHSISRSGLRADLDPSVEIVGEAADVAGAVAVIAELQPDVVLLDVHLPGAADAGIPDASGGEAVLRRSSPLAPRTRFLALSVSDAAEDVVRVIRAGARGYITKGSSGQEVSRAVHAVAGGDAVFSPRLAGFVLDAFGAVAGETATANDELDRLSVREQEVMRLIAWGHSNKEIASNLELSVKTVEVHKANAMKKLGMKSRIDIVRFAVVQGWLQEA